MILICLVILAGIIPKQSQILFSVQEKSKAYDQNVAGILKRFEKFLEDRKFFAGDKVRGIMFLLNKFDKK